MFGIYRTVLALAVVVHHLLVFPVIGHYAVQGFFVLSGYLMTLIMHNTYHYSPKGVALFAINRFLRLFPTYWIIILFSLMLFYFVGESNSVEYRNSMYFPDSFSAWLQNFLMIYWNFFPGEVVPRISPATWALTIELFFYFLIAIGVSKNSFITKAWVFISILYMIFTHVYELGYEYRYFAIISGTLPFSLGALIYHHYGYLKKFILLYESKFISLFLIGAFFFNSVFGILLVFSGNYKILEFFSFYANIAINFAIVISLVQKNNSLIDKRIDKIIGDYSYPIYLMHWQVGLFVSMILWDAPIRDKSFEGILSFGIAVFLCFIFSYFIIKVIDIPIERVRGRVRNR